MSYPPPPQQSPQGYPQPGYPPGPGYSPPVYIPPGGPGIPAEKGRKKYNSFTALFVFFLPDLWRDVGQRWWGIGLIYMFLLQLITWTPLFFMGHATLTKFVAQDAPKLTSQVPKITVNNGTISIDRPEPYTITDPESGQPLVVFDTSGDTTEPPANVPSALVTKHGFSMRKNATQIQTQDLSQWQGVHTLTASDVQGFLDMFRRSWWPVVFPATIILFCLWRLLLMLVLALIGLAFASGTKAPLTYAGLLRLSAIAMTPVILINTVMQIVPALDFGCGWTIVGIIIDLLMLFLVVKANAPKTPAGFSGPQGFPMSPAGWPPSPAPYSTPYPSSSPIPPPPQ
jgi:hypothetical protein